ncbi:Uncharacterised protein [Vibrio cholerae]|uniref:Uncharacterized protein n=1 Tax=Vibrio cholerae TaxID=666 RepID=A0A655U042_VIBCL|nr:Uncharacterised protein [Vibrio cholerae]CSB42296.1 Uncharacterised protein [Vibrio cholerae]CSB52550.1 Uncharacterised protein [Vibrio cholerae]CSD41933.1 Uncharacterised protein [Vibrio cholerae]CSI51743.1 Uncharacterised protein [Vibrio cholerae]
MRPRSSVTAVTPLLVARISGLPNSKARMRAISMCCNGPIERPNQASFESVSRKSVSGVTLSRTCSLKMIS